MKVDTFTDIEILRRSRYQIYFITLEAILSFAQFTMTIASSASIDTKEDNHFTTVCPANLAYHESFEQPISAPQQI